MLEIRLPRGVWKYDPSSPLGAPGGFGAVFAGISVDHDKLAIKKLHVNAQQAAHRELRIADDLIGRDLQHVVPVLDAGQDAETSAYFVVMAQAECSLEDEIGKRRFSAVETAEIMSNIADALGEVSDIVHRDLKPGNVLLHDGKWKVADFGIARFAEEATSRNTLKDCLSPLYAAPEQWKLERATNATDLYALGCIAHTLVRTVD